MALALLRLALALAATAPLPSLTGDLDGDGQVEAVAWSGGELVLSRGATTLGKVAAPSAAGQAGAPVLALVRAGDLPVVHARWELAGGKRQAELVVRLEKDGPAVVYSGVTGPVGDGERAEHLEVGANGVLRYQTAPGVDRCDGEQRLFPELYDAAARRFRPVSLAAPDGTRLAATREIPGFAEAPALGLFRFTAASSERGDQRLADRLAPPRALDDGRPETAWYEGMAGFGRGAWVTARARAPELTLLGLKLTPAPGNRLRRLTLLVGKDASFAVDLPEWRSGAPLWIGLPAPVKATCLSLVLAHADESGADDTGIAEVAIYTALDQAGGAPALARELVRDAPGAASLAQVLVESGTRGVEAMREVLPAAQGEGRQRLLAALAASDVPEAAPLLVDALVGADERTRRLLRDHLRPGRLGEAALPRLLSLASSRETPVQARVDAIRILAAWHEARLAKQVIELALAGRLGDEDATHQAILEAAAGGDAGALLDLVARDLAGQPRDAVTDVRLLAQLAQRAKGKDVEPAARALAHAWQAAPAGDAGFELRFRILRAVRALAPGSLTAIVEEAAAGDDEALRAAAMEAAAQLGKVGEPALIRGAGDRDPGVRLAALKGLGALASPARAATATRALAEDPWPMVREASAELLGEGCPGGSADALVRAATQDRLEVRRAALASLGRCNPGRAGELAARLVEDERAPASLRERAAALVLQLHLPRASALLARALAGILDDPRASYEAGELATSLARGLGAIADPRAEDVLLRAASEPLSPAIRAAAVAALASYCSERALRARSAGQGDEDASVRAAAYTPGRCATPPYAK